MHGNHCVEQSNTNAISQPAYAAGWLSCPTCDLSAITAMTAFSRPLLLCNLIKSLSKKREQSR
jgi:hypothetical protein